MKLKYLSVLIMTNFFSTNIDNTDPSILEQKTSDKWKFNLGSFGL